MRSVELRRIDRLINQLVDVRNSVQQHYEVDFEIEEDLDEVEPLVTNLQLKIEEEVRNI